MNLLVKSLFFAVIGYLSVDPCLARSDSTEPVKVTVFFYYEQVYDAERNVIEGDRTQVPMNDVAVSIRDSQTNALIKRGRTGADGSFKVRVKPGRYSVGTAREYYANRFCGVPPPACLGNRIELPNRGARKNVRVSAAKRVFIVKYVEEFGV